MIYDTKACSKAEYWTLFGDSLSNSKRSGIGIYSAHVSESNVIVRVVHCEFKTTNNEIEYEALITGLTLAKELGVKLLQINSDSQLIVNQVD